jgi:hypothetical protein
MKMQRRKQWELPDVRPQVEPRNQGSGFRRGNTKPADEQRRAIVAQIRD